MGTWGAGSFQNDWALDWLGDLRESKGDSVIRSALREVTDHGGTKHSAPSILERLRGRRRHTDWLTARVAAKALAAAEVVAARLGYPPANSPDGLMEWLHQNASSLHSDLPRLAREALGIVKTNSELKDLWDEGDPRLWREAVGDLERRLELPDKSGALA